MTICNRCKQQIPDGTQCPCKMLERAFRNVAIDPKTGRKVIRADFSPYEDLDPIIIEDTKVGSVEEEL